MAEKIYYEREWRWLFLCMLGFAQALLVSPSIKFVKDNFRQALTLSILLSLILILVGFVALGNSEKRYKIVGKKYRIIGRQQEKKDDYVWEEIKEEDEPKGLKEELK